MTRRRNPSLLEKARRRKEKKKASHLFLRREGPTRKEL